MSTKRIDLTGKVFGRLTVLAYEGSWESGGSTKAHWDCECACGGTRIASTADLRSGKVTACRACKGAAARERHEAAERRRERRREERARKPRLTTEERRAKARQAFSRNGEGQKYAANYKAYRDDFTAEQWRYYHSILRGRTGVRLEAEAVDVVMRDMPPLDMIHAAATHVAKESSDGAKI